MDFVIKPLDDAEVAKALAEPTAEIKAEVEQAITDALVIFEAKFNRMFVRPVVLYDLTGHTAGYAIGTHTIRLNVELLYNEHHDDMIQRTIPHEVAHIVQHTVYPRSKSHGREWGYLMRLLGLPPDRTHSYKTVAARKHERPWVYRCACKDRFVTNYMHDKMQTGSKYFCRSCRENLYFVGRKEVN